MAGVTSSYPAALDSESNLTPPNNGDTLSVADHWLAGNSGPIVAIETELGTDPAGSFTDVKSRLDSGLIEEMDQWGITSPFDRTGTSYQYLTSNWSRYTATNFTKKGTGLTQSSGVFTFPSTGYYLIIYKMMIISQGGSLSYAGGGVEYTNNDSTYYQHSLHMADAVATSAYIDVTSPTVVKITDTANDKIKFMTLASTNTRYDSTTSVSFRTGFISIKLGGV